MTKVEELIAEFNERITDGKPFNLESYRYGYKCCTWANSNRNGRVLTLTVHYTRDDSDFPRISVISEMPASPIAPLDIPYRHALLIRDMQKLKYSLEELKAIKLLLGDN